MLIFPQISIFDGGKCARSQTVRHEMDWNCFEILYSHLNFITGTKKAIFNVKYEIVLRTPYSKVWWGGQNACQDSLCPHDGHNFHPFPPPPFFFCNEIQGFCQTWFENCWFLCASSVCLEEKGSSIPSFRTLNLCCGVPFSLKFYKIISTVQRSQMNAIKLFYIEYASLFVIFVGMFILCLCICLLVFLIVYLQEELRRTQCGFMRCVSSSL